MPTTENWGNLVLVDSGATDETHPFPDHWNGKPPKDAHEVEINLAVGTTPGWKYHGILYFPPEAGGVGQLLPWGKYSRLWKLTGDFNRDTEDPCITHQPSGMTVPIIWDNDLPHIYEKHLEDLRVACRLASIDMKKVATSRLELCLR